ncbi:hypothetical protein [Saccharothrix sp. 6-C]|nr:hypothetical protein [Saccharothrix sp. 6-C]
MQVFGAEVEDQTAYEATEPELIGDTHANLIPPGPDGVDRGP